MINIPFYENTAFPLHNFSAHRISFQKKVYPTVEHAYHAQKFTDERVKEAVRTAPSPLAAKELANTKFRESRISNWQEIKLVVMEALLRAKIEQHKEVRDFLLKTGDEEIIEESITDQFWGVDARGVGQNYTGKILMKLREELRAR
jgi:ribA/ribD-fused uncharacterized protein